ncbi:MAG TPA: 16S rRNA (guanine(527)-N(7))-methyltransferase RsmG [Candidatus Eisenbacteria bacterium]|nr:16S rRNA (guanine(527)-N(7))-methyltransferase RsmG [Candidatus Eisenbacteria bacterium]
MRSESGDVAQPRLPRDLERDHQEFVVAIREWLESCERGLDALTLFTRFGLKVHEHAGRTSLIAAGDRRQIFTRHVLDSLNPLSLFESAPRSILDVGSGGGFPGIPLAIAWPRTSVTLLESRDRKSGFLEMAVRDLGLKNVKVVCDRLERFVPPSREWRPEASFIRAVGGLGTLVPRLREISTGQATWVYFLGADASVEALREELGSIDAREERGMFGGRLLRGGFATA